MSWHPEIQQAIDSAPQPLEPWGMMHILSACTKIAEERDRLREALVESRTWVYAAAKDSFRAGEALNKIDATLLPQGESK